MQSYVLQVGVVNVYILLLKHTSEHRSQMTELLFECYGVPAVAYGIDALFSAHHNLSTSDGELVDALIISSGHQTSHVLPVLNGRLDAKHCKRSIQHKLCALLVQPKCS